MPAIRHLSSLSDLAPYIDQFELGQLQEQGLFSIVVGAFVPSDGSDPTKVRLANVHRVAKCRMYHSIISCECFYIMYHCRGCTASTAQCSTIQRTTTTWRCSLLPKTPQYWHSCTSRYPYAHICILLLPSWYTMSPNVPARCITCTCTVYIRWTRWSYFKNFPMRCVLLVTAS